MTVAIQTQFNNVSPKLTLVSREQEGDTLSTEYKCNRTVVLAGDSMWDCEIETVTVKSIHISETDWGDGSGDTSIHIAVCYEVDGDDEYEGSWRMYTDSGFEEAVSALLGTSVSFTEQGMQDDGYASMEL
jgi:hypothetical protein